MEYANVRSRRTNQKATGKIQVSDDSLGTGGSSEWVRGWNLGIFEDKPNIY